MSQAVGPFVAISTMGCKVNTFESALIKEQAEMRGYRSTTEIAQADIFIINTCTVTAEADRQARQQVRRAIRRNPNAKVVVTGCYAQVDAKACVDIPGVDLVVGNSRKLDIPFILDQLGDAALPPIMVDDLDQEISLPEHLVGGYEGRSRAFVQIQQGCDQGCTFCIIHTARGPNRSFSPDLIKRQIEKLVANGYHEVVICGVDIGSYGSDFEDELGLSDLLRELLSLEGDFRLRLSSIDPAHLDDDLIDVMKRSDRICPQLHLSMQSGNTLILKRMKRRGTREVLYERIEKLRSAIPELVLSADIMVGFPTENQEHFADTCCAVEELGIPFPHVFSYSSRPGTPAARIPKQVPYAERKRRAQVVRELGKRVWRRQATALIGAKLSVLVEGARGSTEQEVMARASNYFSVKLPRDSADFSGWNEVEIAAIDGDSLIARRVP